MLKKLLDSIRWVQEEYWINIVTGTFWSWKTKNVFSEAYLWKLDNPNGLLIANVPYDGVDILFSSPADLTRLLSYIFNYLRNTNNIPFLQDGVFPPIRLIVDESHLYFFSRDFKNFNMEMFTILTQCRKRKVWIYMITQELPQIDKLIRRLVPEVIQYSLWKFGFAYRSLLYFKSTERSDIADEFNVIELKTNIIRPNNIRLLFNKDIQHFYDQKYLTYYICWAMDLVSISEDDFLHLLVRKKRSLLKEIEFNNNPKDYFTNLFNLYVEDTSIPSGESFSSKQLTDEESL